MKILALDLGDKWVGSAISDGLGISCKPFKTVELEQLHIFLEATLPQESIGTVVIGYPKTVSSGGESDQTKKVVALKEELAQKYAEVQGTEITWVLWDERLSSKRAASVQGNKDISKEAKMKSHSIAAAFILQTYLDYLAFHRTSDE